MLSSIDIADCPCSMFRDLATGSYKIDYSLDKDFEGMTELVCNWPVYHQDIAEVFDKGTFQGVTMGQKLPDSNRTRAGYKQHAFSLELKVEDIVKSIDRRASDTTKFLLSGLETKVYTTEVKKDIENVRVILDLQSLTKRAKFHGAAHVASVEFEKFHRSSLAMDQNLKEMCGKVELRLQYREFVRRLEGLSGCENSTSLDILGRFLDPAEEMCKDIEMVLSVMGRAAVAKSVESIVESWVSAIEYHSSSTRGLQQNRLEDEMTVALNGPELVHSRGVVREAMAEYWQESRWKYGHFVRSHRKIKSYGVSHTVDTMTNNPPKVPFMI